MRNKFLRENILIKCSIVCFLHLLIWYETSAAENCGSDSIMESAKQRQPYIKDHRFDITIDKQKPIDSLKIKAKNLVQQQVGVEDPVFIGALYTLDDSGYGLDLIVVTRDKVKVAKEELSSTIMEKILELDVSNQLVITTERRKHGEVREDLVKKNFLEFIEEFNKMKVKTEYEGLREEITGETLLSTGLRGPLKQVLPQTFWKDFQTGLIVEKTYSIDSDSVKYEFRCTQEMVEKAKKFWESTIIEFSASVDKKFDIVRFDLQEEAIPRILPKVKFDRDDFEQFSNIDKESLIHKEQLLSSDEYKIDINDYDIIGTTEKDSGGTRRKIYFSKQFREDWDGIIPEIEKQYLFQYFCLTNLGGKQKLVDNGIIQSVSSSLRSGYEFRKFVPKGDGPQRVVFVEVGNEIFILEYTPTHDNPWYSSDFLKKIEKAIYFNQPKGSDPNQIVLDNIRRGESYRIFKSKKTGRN